MYSLALLAFSSFLLALVIAPLCRELFHRRGLLDYPNDERRIHTAPVPRAGGIIILLAYAGACGSLLLWPLQGGALVKDAFPFVTRLLPAVIVILAVGFVDDIRNLTPFQKLIGQIAAASLAVMAGVRVTSVAGFDLPIWIALPLSLLWLVGCTNAFNLIDGLDGLAAGLGLFATVTVLLAALLHNDIALAMATVPLAGALLGFLFYNFNPATIFLGDSGSLLVGFMLGCFALLWGQKSATLLGMTAPIVALAVPLLDTALTIARRFLRGQSFYKADRGHIHHRLLDRGFTPRKVALLLYSAAGLAAVLSVLLSVLQNHFSILVIILFCGAAGLSIQQLGYVEFRLARRALIDGVSRQHLKTQLSLLSLEQSIRAASSPEECWALIRNAGTGLGCSDIRARLNGLEFTNGTADGQDPSVSLIQIPLPGGDFVDIEHQSEAKAPTNCVDAFANTVGASLGSKLVQLQQTSAKTHRSEWHWRSERDASNVRADELGDPVTAADFWN